MTRGPAKPMRAPGSASRMSPKLAKLAVTPPVVGWVNTEMYSPPFWEKRSRAAAVLAICIRDKIPSCIRAPPLAENRMRGSLFFPASSMSRATFSPRAADMLPMRKRLSSTPTATFWPPMRPRAVTTPSPVPVRRLACSNLAL